MTTPVEPGILDANVLAYAMNADAPQHVASRTLLEAARDPSTRLYVTSQILCEFYSVITNPRRVAAVSSPPQALRILSAWLALPGWMELLRRRPVIGGNIFDLQLVATMLANDVHRIYTFNTRDFEVFPELAVVTP